jgi:enoyl-CoA hydratase
MKTSSASAPTLTTELRDHVLHIVIDNQARLNAFTMSMWAALPRLIREAEQNGDVRVIVLRGAGDKAFSAGADISEFEQTRTAALAASYDELNNVAFETLAASTKPTIAMISGFCMGGGLEVALCCDLRLASSVSQFSVPAAKLGIGYNPRWMRPMLGIVSVAHAKELLFTGRRFSAAEASGMGLVNRVVQPHELEAATTSLAAEIAGNAPLSILAAKRCIDALNANPALQEMADLDVLVDACFASADYVEGRRAFMEKRKAVFKGK